MAKINFLKSAINPEIEGQGYKEIGFLTLPLYTHTQQI